MTKKNKSMTCLLCHRSETAIKSHDMNNLQQDYFNHKCSKGSFYVAKDCVMFESRSKYGLFLLVGELPRPKGRGF